MLEIKTDELVASFPQVHPEAQMQITFQRTLRIPDDDNTYPLPPGLGQFPLRHIDDYSATVPKTWIERGGLMMPMYQSEALWLNFHSPYIGNRRTSYPFAVKVGTGKINAVTGQAWGNGLAAAPQNYLVVPTQPWLDGYCVEKGYIRQFVAMPLGEGYTAEEQITGKAEHGGLQIEVYPMRATAFERRYPVIPEAELKREEGRVSGPLFSVRQQCVADMGLAPGGRMEQEIFEDDYGIADWDTRNTSRCFIHIANSIMWRRITGEPPLHPPATAKDYAAQDLPWFDYYDDTTTPLPGAEPLGNLKSVFTLGKEKGKTLFSDDEPVEIGSVMRLRKGLKPSQVREGRN